MLKMVARRFMRKSLREEWKQAKKANKKLKATVLAQQGDIE
jgi:hypothetical protein